LATTRDGGVEDRIEVGFAGAKWTVAGDRLESFEFEQGPVYGSVAGATVTAGLEAKRRIGRAEGIQVEVAARAGLSATGIDPETVRFAFSRDDAWALRPAHSNERSKP
ncbi:MAG TPA: hypothetical protein VD838_09810, partial [Anaeromyxobacteraceae bacterium]|nr:hypothetical protein [Anaeromyxobacteraceae bacterium]